MVLGAIFHLAAIAFATEESGEQAPAPAAPTWEYIVIHHSATRSGSARAFDHDHRSRGMVNGLAYHFVINNGRGGNADGEVETGERWLKQLPGGHCRNQRNNALGIGICLVGDFSDSKPTAKQMDALVVLVKKLQEEFHIPLEAVLGHGDLFGEQTECPGARFPWGTLTKRLEPDPASQTLAVAPTNLTVTTSATTLAKP